jgi:spore protease
MRNVRTDLAIEAREVYQREKKKEIPGVEVEEDRQDYYTVTRVKVYHEIGEKIIGKPLGNYITIECPDLRDNSLAVQEEISKVLSQELKAIMKLDKKSTTLVVGLGNWNITPDALGPKVVDSLMVTRHLLEYIPEEVDDGVSPVCAMAPGVLGITGMETSEVIRGVVDRIKPDVLIAIDALASRKMERIGTTIQISDSGISPGSGVGNNRKELSKKTMGIPVIAIGVPTVVDAATMANDTIEMVVSTLMDQTKEKNFYDMLKNMNTEERYNLINEIMTNQTVDNLMVTPKEVDSLISDISKILANGINFTLHEGITYDDINRYIN